MRSIVWTFVVSALVATSTAQAPSLLAAYPARAINAAPVPALSGVAAFPFKEKLKYHIEWRMITAGTAELELAPISAQTWEIKMKLQSQGLVNRLYYVHDDYLVRSDKQFCAATSAFNANEGKRRRITTLNFDSVQKRVHYQERDLVKAAVNNRELDVPACTHEILGALGRLRTLSLEPGKSTQVPVTDGKRLAYVKIEAQERENITVNGTNYSTIRYEAFVFDNILYQRKGMLHIWITDDADRVPVQLRIGLSFPIYNILLMLDKRER